MLGKGGGAPAGYMESQPKLKLHLGAGQNHIPGWFNTDLAPQSAEISHLDVTEPLPFPDASWDYVFLEHLFEHITYRKGFRLLEEILRILKPNGRVRIATPDLGQLVALFTRPGDADVQRYMDWAVSFNKLPETGARPCHVMNRLMHGFGHRFVYDAETLRSSLETVGLTDVAFFEPGKSDDPALRDLEGHGRLIGDSNNRYETIVAEAQKP